MSSMSTTWDIEAGNDFHLNRQNYSLIRRNEVNKESLVLQYEISCTITALEYLLVFNLNRSEPVNLKRTLEVFVSGYNKKKKKILPPASFMT